MSDWALRRARVEDREPMAALTAAGFETYLAFAPADWSPPDSAVEVERLGRLLADPDVWYLVAEHDGAIVGHVGFLPARSSIAPSDEATLGHFRQLFVARDQWGAGLATTLHAAALVEAADRGYRTMRLFTPAGQTRARRFYEREGWALARPTFYDARIGLEMAEYRRAL